MRFECSMEGIFLGLNTRKACSIGPYYEVAIGNILKAF